MADDPSIGLVSTNAAKSQEPRFIGAVRALLYGYIVDTDVYGWLTAGWLTRKSGDPVTLGHSKAGLGWLRCGERVVEA